MIYNDQVNILKIRQQNSSVSAEGDNISNKTNRVTYIMATYILANNNTRNFVHEAK